MQPKNFPARKLARKVRAEKGRELTDAEWKQARETRTKKRRDGK